MPQRITTKYQAYDTSTVQNERYVNVVPAGVYAGYSVTVNPGMPNVLDVTTGADTVSTLVTSEGVVITETTTVVGAVKLDKADPSFSRYDLVVAEYAYNTKGIGQVYRVIRGPNQLNIGSEPLKPVPTDKYQVPLAYVLVRAKTQAISNIDIYPVQKINWSNTALWDSLRPEIVVSQNTLLYVYPGVLPNSDGTEILSFPGGYSTAITDSTFTEGSERWYLFGVTDDLTIKVISYAATKAALPKVSSDVFVVARVRARKNNGKVELLQLEDMRIPFSRSGFTPNEDLKYQELLAHSVFQYLRVEQFNNLNLITSNTTTGGTLVLDSANKSIVLSGTLAADVTFVTGDIIKGSAISVVEQFMLVADSTIQNLKFDYSTVSPLSGFTGRKYAMGELVKVANTFASQLYIKFYVPAAEFVGGQTTRIYSYGVLLNLDKSAISSYSITELGLRDLTNSINNLINNGDFYYWAKNTINNKRADLRTQGELIFPISEDAPHAADGWQFTSINGSFSSDSIKRIFISNTTNRTTALQLAFQPNTATGSTEPTVLEYRIGRAFELSGKKLTFAIDYFVDQPASLIIGIAQFRRTDAGLVLIQTDEAVAQNFNGTVQVTTASSIDVNTAVVSFYIKFAANVAINTTLWHARAAIGEFPVLSYAYVVDANDNLRSYYERGSFYLATYAQAGTIIGSSAQFGSPKHTELGTVTARTIQSATADRSANVSSVTYTADRDTLSISATAASSSSVIIQTEWEAFINYEGSVV